MLTKINGSSNFNKTCKQFHYILSNAQETSGVNCFIYMSVLLTSLTKSMDPYIQSLHKRIKWQFKHEDFYCVFSSDIFYYRTRFYSKNENFLKSPKAKFHAIWILTTYSNKLESLHNLVSPFYIIFMQDGTGK